MIALEPPLRGHHGTDNIEKKKTPESRIKKIPIFPLLADDWGSWFSRDDSFLIDSTLLVQKKRCIYNFTGPSLQSLANPNESS